MKPVVIIGAGISGLMAGTALRQSGIPAVLVEKSRGFGGRMATRRFADGIFDHGVNAFTVQNRELREPVNDWLNHGLLTVWFESGSQSGPLEKVCHYIGTPSMTALPKYLAQSLSIIRNTRVTSLKPTNGGWHIITDNTEDIPCSAVLFTPPTPQTLEILDRAEIQMEKDTNELLRGISYEPAIMLLAYIPSASPLPGPGYFLPRSGPLFKVIDNATKGISDTPGYFTVQCRRIFSDASIDRSDEEISSEVIPALEDMLNACVDTCQVHRWRYSRPVNFAGMPCVETSADSNLFIAGDGIGGRTVEASMRSGVAAVQILCSRFDRSR